MCLFIAMADGQLWSECENVDKNKVLVISDDFLLVGIALQPHLAPHLATLKCQIPLVK